ERAARAIEPVVAGTKTRRGVDEIAQEEVRRIDEDAAVRFAGDRKAPQNRLGEGVFNRLALERIAAARTEAHVALHHHDARTDALELHDARAAAGSTIETDVIRSHSGRQR